MKKTYYKVLICFNGQYIKTKTTLKSKKLWALQFPNGFSFNRVNDVDMRDLIINHFVEINGNQDKIISLLNEREDFNFHVVINKRHYTKDLFFDNKKEYKSRFFKKERKQSNQKLKTILRSHCDYEELEIELSNSQVHKKEIKPPMIKYNGQNFTIGFLQLF